MYSLIATVLAATLVLIPLSGESLAGMIRVDPSGGGDALTVSAGMALAASGDTVAVRQGTHMLASVEVVGGVRLLGGWNDTFDSRVPGTSLLMATGLQALKCQSGQGLDTLIDGFEVTGATHSAILLTGSSATISNCEIHDNSGADGAAIHCEHGASPIIKFNHIHHNSANYGGGIRGHWGFDTSPIIRDNLIEYNSAQVAGGGIGVNNGSAIIEDNVIRYNTAQSTGGGVHVWHGEGGIVEIRRNLIAYNECTDDGGGIGINGGHPIIENNTLWGNTAWDYGASVSQATSILYDPGTTQFSRNIVGGSIGAEAIECINDFMISIDCTCLHENAGGDFANCPPSTNDMVQDPFFCDLAGGGFEIRSNSPCAAPGPLGCGLVGAYDVGCGPVSIESTSWGEIKSRYR